MDGATASKSMSMSKRKSRGGRRYRTERQNGSAVPSVGVRAGADPDTCVGAGRRYRTTSGRASGSSLPTARGGGPEEETGVAVGQQFADDGADTLA